jgi:hypothetical protein
MYTYGITSFIWKRRTPLHYWSTVCLIRRSTVCIIRRGRQKPIEKIVQSTLSVAFESPYMKNTDNWSFGSFGRSVVRVVLVVRVIQSFGSFSRSGRSGRSVVRAVRVVQSFSRSGRSVVQSFGSFSRSVVRVVRSSETLLSIQACGMRYAVYATTTATATTTTNITSTSLHCIVGTVHGTMVTNQGQGNNARHYVAAVIQLSERRWVDRVDSPVGLEASHVDRRTNLFLSLVQWLTLVLWYLGKPVRWLVLD